MTDFAHESRSRKHTLLRMASSDPVERRLVRAYAEMTPEPPPLAARRGIATRGCPHCSRTMWRQWDEGPLWVCSACGHMVDGGAAEELDERTPGDGGAAGSRAVVYGLGDFWGVPSREEIGPVSGIPETESGPGAG